MVQGADARGAAWLEPLDELQLGHLRHIDNLSRRPANDWSLMGSRTPGQDDFAAYRYQLGYGALTLALGHFHRLPAAPGAFRGTFDRLIQKMLLPEVWMYWRDTSSGRSLFNSHIPMESEWDPVRRDNIMYSAYVQVMTLLYDYLFDDDKYTRSGSITFRHHSFAWGGDAKVFEYDQDSLNELIYWKMVESGYIGVACEPNCVFQICNQIPLLGFRIHDLLNGGNRAEQVSAGYAKAWDEYGRVDEQGRYNVLLLEEPRRMLTNDSDEAWVDAWSGTVLNMLNRDFVRTHYGDQMARMVVPGPDDTLSIRPLAAVEFQGNQILDDHADFGWAAAWASEMGDLRTRDRLLKYADDRMVPSWSDGGLYYPRHDELTDASGNHTLMDPLTGNILLGYARLNVPDGLWSLYHRPLPPDQHRRPALTTVDRDVDVRTAHFDTDTSSLHFSLRSNRFAKSQPYVAVGRLQDAAGWVLERDGHILGRRNRGGIDLDDPAVAHREGELIVEAHPEHEEYTLHVE